MKTSFTMFTYYAKAIFAAWLLIVLNAFGESVTYTYDPLNRLTQVTYANGSTISYTYDAAGNRLTYSGISTNGGDSVSPGISILSPTNGATYATASSSVTLSGLASDNVGISKVTWMNDNAEIGLALGTTNWTIPNLPLHSGANSFNLTAHDLAGNIANAFITIIDTTPDTTGPAVTITFPTNHATVTSATLTVTGTASDSTRGSSGVSSVTVNGLNASGGSSSGASIASWTATTTLVPGVNTITAVARDAFNNSNQQQITVTYHPPDTTAPAVAITFPANNATVSNASLTVTGTASDSTRGNSGVSSVTVNGLNVSGGTASGANTANWSATITLNPGVNTITAVARDTFNNFNQQQITVTYSPPPCVATLLNPASDASVSVPPTFSWSFTGSCSNKVYVATNPVPDQMMGLSNVFQAGRHSLVLSDSEWNEVVERLGVSPVYYWTVGYADSDQVDEYAEWRPFTMATGPRPGFLATKGSYSGLFAPVTGATHPSSGFFSATTTTKGTYSAQVRLAGKKYSFSGKFSTNGTAFKTVARSKLNPLLVQLQRNVTDRDLMTGQISDGAWTAELLADRATFHAKTNRAPQAGKYTLVIAGSTNSTTEPGGHGVGTLTVNTAGSVTFAGTLADGTKVTQNAVLSKQGDWPFYASLYSGKGLALGWLSFASTTGDDLHGGIAWVKPLQTSAKFYPAGFAFTSYAIGSRYGFVQSTPVLDLPSGGIVALEDGNLNGLLLHNVTWPASKVVTGSGAINRLSLQCTTSSGRLTGSFTHPVTGKKTTITGVVFQKQETARGFFLGPNQSGAFSLDGN